MLATMLSPSEHITKELDLAEVEHGKNVKATDEKKSVFRERKPVIYENLTNTDWRPLQKILFGHPSHNLRIPCPTNLAGLVSEFSDEEWAWLKSASHEVARIARLPKPLCNLHDYLVAPVKVISEVVTAYAGCRISRFFDAYVSREPEMYQRWMYGWYASFGSTLFKILTRYPHDCPLARMINALIHTRPCRSDWQTCPLEELKAAGDFIWGSFDRFRMDLSHSTLHYEAVTVGEAFYQLAVHCQVLFQYSRILSETETGPLKAVIDSSDVVSSGCLQVFPKDQKAPKELPDTACGLVLNPISNAIAPFFPALDECGLRLMLFPEQPSVWEAMIALYNMPKRDALFPESNSVQIRLSPNSGVFMHEMAEKHDLVYLGTQGLGKYVDIPDPDNPDYQFHAFIRRG